MKTGAEARRGPGYAYGRAESYSTVELAAVGRRPNGVGGDDD
jgi:hypothetical protein